VEHNAGKSLFPNLLVTIPKAMNLIVQNLNNKEKLKPNKSAIMKKTSLDKQK
jgi:hypothetical protein